MRSARTDDGWVCEVEVRDAATSTHHTVTVSRDELERLGGPGSSPEALVEHSFAFLLAREPKESILRTFDLEVIGRYFPEYPEAMARER